MAVQDISVIPEDIAVPDHLDTCILIVVPYTLFSHQLIANEIDI